VNVALKTNVPAVLITVPVAGLYTNVPGTFAVAFNCAALSAVPAVTAAGVVHVIVGVCFAAAFTVNDTVFVTLL